MTVSFERAKAIHAEAQNHDILIVALSEDIQVNTVKAYIILAERVLYLEYQTEIREAELSQCHDTIERLQGEIKSYNDRGFLTKLKDLF